MAASPVIYLAFAQDESDHLPMLKRESQLVYRSLQALHDKQFIEIYRDDSTVIDELFVDFRRFKGRIAIFHYAGHADGNHLMLEDQAASSEGLSQLISQESEHLKLVFLNGCSTKGQVTRLHELGIDAVLATSVPISDEKATRFAGAFYRAMADHFSLEQAFMHASALAKTSFGADFDVNIHRSIDWSGVEEGETGSIPWGLYIREGADAVLQWKLPQMIKVEAPQFVNKTTEVNQGIRSILQAMVEHAPELQAEARNPRKAPITIVENFPWVMGAQIRKLFANTEQMNQPGRARLKQLIHSYVCSTRFLSYVLLSQLWDSLRGKFTEYSAEWEGFFPVSKENYDQFDYIHLLGSAHNLLKSDQPFISEIGESVKRLRQGEVSFGHYQFLESVRLRLINNQIDDGEVRQLCYDTEAALTDLLIRASFLAKYRLITVKDIRIFSPKFINPQFNHRLGELNVPHKDYIWEDDRSLNVYTDSHSVLLIRKDENEIEQFLNLSPFVIDKSAFLASQVPAIYTFAYPDSGAYAFQSVDMDINNTAENDSDMLSIGENQQEYQMVYQLFELFQEDLNRKVAT